MGSLFNLVLRNQEDLLINLIAGIPFLMVDLVIITILLPRAIEWWDERRWRVLRRKASGRLAIAYLETGKINGDVADLSHLTKEVDRKEDVKDRLIGISNRIENMGFRLETGLQTVLIILGPRDAQTMMEFHVSWLNYLDDTVSLLRALANNNYDSGLDDAFQRIDDLNEKAARTGILYHNLLTNLIPELDTGHRPGVFWDGVHLDMTAQSLESIAQMLIGGNRMSFQARGYRSEQRLRRINVIRLNNNMEQTRDKVTVWNIGI